MHLFISLVISWSISLSIDVITYEKIVYVRMQKSTFVGIFMICNFFIVYRNNPSSSTNSEKEKVMD